MDYRQRRGTAIVESDKGILVTSGRGRVFITPGGGAKRKESRMQAAIRELKEETGLEPYFAMALFRFTGPQHRTHQDLHTVYYIKAKGIPRPKHEVKHIAFYTPGSEVRLSSSTKEIVNKYYAFKQKHSTLFEHIKKL